MSAVKIGDTYCMLENYHLDYLSQKFGDLSLLKGANLQNALEFINAPKS